MTDWNRVAWSVIFFLGSGVFALLGWHGSEVSAMAWFILTSLWSAFCAIGYTVLYWFISSKIDCDQRQ